MESKRTRNTERERRDSRQQLERERQSGRWNPEQRSREKVQEILRSQKGDMSAYAGHLSDAAQGECDKLLSASVASIMSGRVAVLSFDDNLLTVQGIFASVKFRHLPIVDEGGRIIGIISDRDFLRMVSPFFGTVNEQNRDKEIMMRRVGTIMTRNPVCAEGDISILEAIRIMNGNKISCLPIVTGEEKVLSGIVTWKDVVRLFCPSAFNAKADSVRLKAGVSVNPEKSESARLKAKASESARLRAVSAEPAAVHGQTARMSPPPPSVPADRPRSDTAHIEAPDSRP